MIEKISLCSRIQKNMAIAVGLGCLVATLNVAAGAEMPSMTPRLTPLNFLRGIPFIAVTVGAVETELMFDSGGKLGLTLPDDIIQRSGSVKVLAHKSKFGDAAGNVYEVADLLADKVYVAGVSLSTPIAGRAHYSWGLNISSGDAEAPDDLTRKQLNGAIGLEAFDGRALLFDYAHRQLGIYQPGQLPDLSASGWQVFDLKYDNEGPQITLNSAGKSLHFILDTGANLSTLKPSAINDADACSKTAELSYCGARELTDLQALGGQRLAAQKFVMVEMKEVTFDGILGGDFFSKYLVLFDLAHRKLWIKDA